MNVMHSSMKITDEYYSVLNDGEIKNRISSLGSDIEKSGEEEIFQEFQLFMA